MSFEPETWLAPPGSVIPNNPRFEVLVYRALPLEDPRGRFALHGWGGTWVSNVFDFHHFHSTSHEALAVLSGNATIELGGPQGQAFEVSAGDVLVLPAGTGHRRARDADGFRVMGAYPAGQEDYDLLRAADEAALARIAALGVPPDDPVGGAGVARWREAE
jgi:uncharacterized protein YjlB